MIVSLLLIVGTLKAQFDPQLGHYMYMPSSFNPAAAGEGELMKVSATHRMQFTGIEGAPMSTYFTLTSAFHIGKTRHGAGLRVLNDMYGLWKNQTFCAQYAYRQKIGKGYLGIGIELGLVNIIFTGDSVNLGDMEAAGSEIHIGSDPAIPVSESSGMQFDMGAGLYYSTSRWFAGLSYSHILQPRVELINQSGSTNEISMRVRGTFYATGAYKFKIRNSDFALQPSAMLMTDFASWNLDLTLMTEFKQRYRWGLSYRVLDRVGLLLGMEIISGLELGYNYELPTSKLLLESYGNHEIYLSYGFNIIRPKRTNKYKSVRFL